VNAPQNGPGSLTGSCEALIEDAVLEQHPGLRLTLLAAPAHQFTDSGEVAAAEQEVVAELLAAFPSEDDLRSGPEDELYRSFYRAMGLKAAQVSTPVKQALRVQRNGEYRSRSFVVDTAMAIEYSTLVSFQVYSGSRIGKHLSFILAHGDEPITTMRGESKTCKLGELLLVGSDGRVAHSCYYGNDPAFLLSEQDELAIVRVMGVPGLDDSAFQRAVQEAVHRMSPVDVITLDESTPRSELSLTSQSKGDGA
jgi:DNA/RNA-binding domain of Phe-tRNA-synthetase-like protein